MCFISLIENTLFLILLLCHLKSIEIIPPKRRKRKIFGNRLVLLGGITIQNVASQKFTVTKLSQEQKRRNRQIL